MKLTDRQRTQLELILRNWVNSQKTLAHSFRHLEQQAAWSNIEFDSLMCSIERLIDE